MLFAEEADRSWRLGDILVADSMVEISGLKARFGDFACGPYPEGANVALARALRIPGVSAPLGIVIAGISPRLPFDLEYRGHVERVANGVATALGNALAYQRERQRAEELAELDRAKTAFFSNVSHEFRTPLPSFWGQSRKHSLKLRENVSGSAWNFCNAMPYACKSS